MSEAELERIASMLGPELAVQSSLTQLRSLRMWEPREYQMPLWSYLQDGGRRACVIWHRRSGKDSVALNWAAESALRRVGEYWHMLPEAAQGRKVIWDAVSPHDGRRLIDQAFPSEFVAARREQDMSVKLVNGSLWRVVGSDNYDRLVGATPAGVVFSEWALADPNAWAFIRPILMENGGWAIFITTPRGNNHAKTTLNLARSEPEWFAQVLPASETGVFTDDQLAGERRELQHEYGTEEGAALFEQEYNCSFASALLGSYYGVSLARMRSEGRIGIVPPSRGALVHTAWDLGVSDSTAIWFIQAIGRQRLLLDYHEASGSTDLDVYVKVLEDKRQKYGWIYGTHFFPHDVAHGQQGNPDGNRVNTLKRLGVTPVVVPLGNVNDGINAVRRLLDAAWANEATTERGIDALSAYRRQWNEKTKAFADAPYHDWSSHGSDALRTFACGFREAREKPSTGRIPIIGPTQKTASGTGWMRH